LPFAEKREPSDPECFRSAISDLPLPEAWPHHASVTSDTCDAESILAAFAREGWKAERVYNGPPNAGFGLVRGWIENQFTIEIGGREMRDQYERFFQEAMARSAAVPA